MKKKQLQLILSSAVLKVRILINLDKGILPLLLLLDVDDLWKTKECRKCGVRADWGLWLIFRSTFYDQDIHSCALLYLDACSEKDTIYMCFYFKQGFDILFSNHMPPVCTLFKFYSRLSYYNIVSKPKLV